MARATYLRCQGISSSGLGHRPTQLQNKRKDELERIEWSSLPSPGPGQGQCNAAGAIPTWHVLKWIECLQALGAGCTETLRGVE